MSNEFLNGPLEGGAEQFRADQEMEQLMRNVESMNQLNGLGDAGADQAIRNLEELGDTADMLAAGGRAAAEELTAGGVVREVFTAVVEAVDEYFHPEKALERESVESARAELEENVDAAAREWHVQEQDNTCAVACQEFILNEYMGIDVSEASLTQLAETQGWFCEDGTPYADIGNLLEAYGIETEVRYDGNYEALRDAVQDGNRVIVGVNNVAMVTEWCDGYPGFSANHAIEVVAIDDSDPENVKVIINDPGVEDGCAKEVTLDNFLDAWSTSGGYMLTALRN